MNQAGLF